MNIRQAVLADSEDILSWRNDTLTSAMSFQSMPVSEEDHQRWFEFAIASPSSLIFIGEIDEMKIGVCRFSIDEDNATAEISINVNPSSRGQGLAQPLLDRSVALFRKRHPIDILAKVKPENAASIRIFSKGNFYQTEIIPSMIVFKNPISPLSFETVTTAHTKPLYKLLEARQHSISHQTVPDFIQHQHFVENHPYRQWVVVINNGRIIGSVYLQDDNSVGINITTPALDHLSQILSFIQAEFTLCPAIPSKVPDYFHINTAITDDATISALNSLGLEPIQITHKIV